MEEFIQHLSLLNNCFSRSLNNGLQYLLHSRHTIDNLWRITVTDCKDIWDVEMGFEDASSLKDKTLGKDSKNTSWESFFKGLKAAFTLQATAVNISSDKRYGEQEG
eukprot:TRINITY_DN2250_c0_g1_i5.p1 TRINITY_DN2250_c0_g1~~TRINITY_DN2250_c0_g1_i5.p1  ORF type:complete len:106 (-),score=16.57 TRINITY_DN2250_c0_g1_i5:600-917(-)